MLLFHNDTCESPLVLTKNKLWILEMGVLNIKSQTMRVLNICLKCKLLNLRYLFTCFGEMCGNVHPPTYRIFGDIFWDLGYGVVSHSKRAFFTSRKFQTLGPPFVPVGKQQQFGRKLKILFATQVTFRLEWVVGVWAASCSSYSQRSL